MLDVGSLMEIRERKIKEWKVLISNGTCDRSKKCSF